MFYETPTGRVEYLTPRVVLDPVCQVFNGPPDLDPCAGATGGTVGARVNISYPERNGLDLEHWRDARTVFCNPPYGLKNGERRFMETCRWHGGRQLMAGRVCQAIGLIPAKTDSKLWQEVVWGAPAICFWRGRIKFVGEADSAKFPVALPYWGQHPDKFADIFSPFGKVVLNVVK